MSNDLPDATPEQRSLIGRLLGFFLKNRLIALLLVVGIVAAGLMTAPFDWELGDLPRSPVPTDAIPDIGENQQIVFTEWPGRSPQDVEDQITYPLTVAMLGVPGVKTIRSYSYFGFSTVYVIFKEFSLYERLIEGKDFYWTRSRVLEKLNSLPARTVPPGVRPALGPDATALGQIFWYTLEGRDPDGEPVGGWDLEELRTVQDWYVRYGLASAEGVAEVASVGGFVREYQVDVDPDSMRAYGVSLAEVFGAVRASNIDVGAQTIELNRVEYFIRGIGFIKDIADIENSVIKVRDNVPVLVKHVATVTTGPAPRRGTLDKDGAEAVGGVVVARFGANPLEVIKNVKKKIEEISPGLATKAVVDWKRATHREVQAFAEQHGFEAFDGPGLRQAAWVEWLRETRDRRRDLWPEWVTLSQVTVVPFYDRTGLIYETLGTLSDALAQEILITLIVVVLMVMHLRSSILIGGMLPLAVLLCFVAMRFFRVDANIVALSGIAIAIGTIVDMGIVICENILRHTREAPPEADRLAVVHRAVSEVGGAVVTAVMTTVISFLPIFVMIGAEGKLFRPLAFTKTFALVASILIALTVVPPAAHTILGWRIPEKRMRRFTGALLVAAALALGLWLRWWVGVVVALPGLYLLLKDLAGARLARAGPWAANLIIVGIVGYVLAAYWEPLGPERGIWRNVIFVGGLIGVLLGFFRLFQLAYPRILRLCLILKVPFLLLTGLVTLFGAVAWLGFDRVFRPVSEVAARIGIEPRSVRSTTFWVRADESFPGLGKEFMPPLDEGSFLYMPTTMVHASIGEALDVLSKQDMALAAIPEIERVVGKIGRVDSPLDPAPVSMIETVITYKPEYVTDKDGRRQTFRYDEAAAAFVRDSRGVLIPDPRGRPLRNWRDQIRTPDDIWKEILRVTEIPGTTSAPKLQPIAARLVMLQSGMRAPMGVKVSGPDSETIERVGLAIERFLKEVPGVEPATVLADRIVGKPYLEIVPDRQALARHGVPIRAFQDVIEVAIGGRPVTTTVEGRERFGVRVRYQRELRDQIETISRILIPAADGSQIPLEQVAEIRYARGPQAIKSEDTFKTGYVTFDLVPGNAEVDVVETCQAYLKGKIDRGELVLPPGVSYRFAGTYEQQVRSQKTLAVVLPVALFLIFLVLYFQFKSVPTTLLVFSGVFVAWSGGFILLWLYSRPWFLDFSVFDVSMSDLFQIHTVNLSVAVWVGFLALFGIATDDGVVMSTYLEQRFRDHRPATVSDIRAATIAAGGRRVRACLMTTATTILALIPVLTSVGRGSDVMVPMAIPSVGGMTIAILTMLVVPVLYCTIKEFGVHTRLRHGRLALCALATVLVGAMVAAAYGSAYGFGYWTLAVFVVATAATAFLLMAAYCTVHDLLAVLKHGRQGAE